MVPFAITQHLRGPNVVFCMSHFPLWRPNHKKNWHFTKKIKFCLVPCDPKNSKKKLKKICWKKVEKMLKIAYFQHFFDDFQHFFKKNFNIFFATFFAFLGSPGTKQNFIFWCKVSFHNGFSSSEGFWSISPASITRHSRTFWRSAGPCVW